MTLNIKNLKVSIDTPDGIFDAVSSISLDIQSGETVALVGESGCGKTMTSLAVIGHLADQVFISGGSIHINGEDVTGLDPYQRRKRTLPHTAMIFQEPMTSLNPVMRVGDQLIEAIQIRFPVSRSEAKVRAIKHLDLVQIPEAKKRFRSYPHELSGGQRQRVMIAMALASEPDLLVADEPTTALDVIVQAEILALIRDLCKQQGIGLLLITHDLGVVARMADQVAVMYRGEIVEAGTVEKFFAAPIHPYTNGLINCLPGEGRELVSIKGLPPRLGPTPRGCGFAERCDEATSDCENSAPLWTAQSGDHGHLCGLKGSFSQ